MRRAADAPEPRRADLLAHLPRLGGEGWSAAPDIPADHPYFSDHPRDEIDGTLAVAGLLDLVTAVGGRSLARPGRRLVLDLTFPGPGVPDLLTTRPEPGVPGRWSVEAAAEGRVVCAGTLNLLDAVGARPGVPPRTGVELCPQELVDREFGENVLIGLPDRDTTSITTRVLTPPPGHYLEGPGEATHSARSLLEACLQFLTVLQHWATCLPADVRMVWLSFHADLPAVPAPEGTYSLRWHRQPPKDRRISMDLELLGGTGEVAGGFGFDALAVSPAAYRRIRDAARRREW